MKFANVLAGLTGTLAGSLAFINIQIERETDVSKYFRAVERIGHFVAALFIDIDAFLDVVP